MKKRLFILVSLVLSAIFLVACSNHAGGAQTSLDGEYYIYHKEENIVITDNILKIDGKVALYKDSYFAKYGDENTGELWSVDTDKQTISKPDERSDYPYTIKEGVLTFGYYNDQYVKKGTNKYNKATKMREWEYKNN